MRRVVLSLVVLALSSAIAAQTPQQRPLQADPVVGLLSDLEGALVLGRSEDFAELAAADLPAADALVFTRAIARGPAAAATVRERARRPVDDGFEILAEVFVNHGRVGRIATWQLTTRPVVDEPGRFELTSLSELAAIDDLLKLTLDPEQQFEIDDLTLRAPDMVLTMSSGSAFVAESPNGVTALVLQGRGEMRFTPSDAAEQGQLRIFAGEPEYVTSVDQAYVRMNAADFVLRVSSGSLKPVRVDRGDLNRATQIFGQMAPRTFNLDLRDLTSERWSIEPAFGSMMVEFKTRRHGWLTYARTPGDAEDVVLFDRDGSRNISVYASDETQARRGTRFYSEDDRTAFDVLRYGLDLTFDPDREWVAGRGTLRIRIKPPGASTLTLRLASSLEVSAVTSLEFGRLLTLRVAGQNNILVGLPSFVTPGTELVLDVQYSGRLRPQALDREAMAVQQRSLFQDPEFVQQPERRFMYSNRSLWYPQAGVSDYAAAAMRLTVPSEYQIVASGSPIGSSVTQIESEDTTRSMRTVEYVADRPARYLAVIISRFMPVGNLSIEVPAIAPPEVNATSLTQTPVTSTSVGIEVVSTPRMTRSNRDLPERVAGMIRFFAETIGEAPYPDFTLAAVDDLLPGGHSPAFFGILHQPLPSTPFRWADDPVWFGHYPRLFLAHEVAHQWWGQAVGWKNYHEQWLSEGLAQYFAVLYAEHDRGPDLARSLLEQMRASAEDNSDQGPIYLGYRLGHIESKPRVFRSIIYNKSAVVLHMLRTLIGDDAFVGGVRRFYSEWRFRKAGTDDLRAAFEAGTDIPLERFFERWIMGATLPDVRVRADLADDRLSAVVRVEQTGATFDFPLTLQVEYADGGSETIVVPVLAPKLEHPIRSDRPIRRVSVDDRLVPGNIRN